MARGVPCGKEEVNFHRCGAKLKFLISYDLFTLRRRGKKIQPRRAFKKEVSYPAVITSIDCPYTSSPRLFPPSQLRLSCFAFEFWTAVERSLSGEWGYTVRNRDNGSDSEQRRIRMISSIYVVTKKQASGDIRSYSKYNLHTKIVPSTTLQVVSQ